MTNAETRNHKGKGERNKTKRMSLEEKMELENYMNNERRATSEFHN